MVCSFVQIVSLFCSNTISVFFILWIVVRLIFGFGVNSAENPDIIGMSTQDGRAYSVPGIN